MEQALVVGRLAEFVGEESSSLAVILGSPDDWAAFSATGRLGLTQTPAAAIRHTRSHRAAGAARLEPISIAMQQVSRRAFSMWVSWAGAGLADTFQAELAHESSLHARSVPPNWEEIVVESSDEALSMDSMAIRFGLPAQPTTATLRLLMHACNELQRAGAASVARGALALLAFELQVRLYHQFMMYIGKSKSVVNRQLVVPVYAPVCFTVGCLFSSTSLQKRLFEAT